MLKLHGFPVSNYHNKVKIALMEKGIVYEEVHLRPSQDAAVLAASAMGKVPFLELDDGATLTESEVILEYLEDAFPENPIFPREPLARARVRELITHMELDLELPARRLYRGAFFGGQLSDETKQITKADIDKGVRAFMRMAKFSPWVAGEEFSAADCAAAVHLPLVSLVTKTVYGEDAFAAHADVVKSYIRLVNERASVAQVMADRKVYQDAMKKK